MGDTLSDHILVRGPFMMSSPLLALLPLKKAIVLAVARHSFVQGVSSEENDELLATTMLPFPLSLV